MDIDTIAIRGLEHGAIRKLSRRSDLRGLLQLASHTILLLASGLLVGACRGGAWLGPAIVVDGIVLAFLFCALHESIHRTAFASRWLNEVVGWICGALLLLPPEYFRLFHFAHHRHTQNPSQDPELAQAGLSSVRSYVWRVSGLPVSCRPGVECRSSYRRYRIGCVRGLPPVSQRALPQGSPILTVRWTLPRPEVLIIGSLPGVYSTTVGLERLTRFLGFGRAAASSLVT